MNLFTYWINEQGGKTCIVLVLSSFLSIPLVGGLTFNSFAQIPSVGFVFRFVTFFCSSIDNKNSVFKSGFQLFEIEYQ